jgi:hypothetical protein
MVKVGGNIFFNTVAHPGVVLQGKPWMKKDPETSRRLAWVVHSTHCLWNDSKSNSSLFDGMTKINFSTGKQQILPSCLEKNYIIQAFDSFWKTIRFKNTIKPS